MIQRGAEIARSACHAPTVPTSSEIDRNSVNESGALTSGNGDARPTPVYAAESVGQGL